MKWTIIATISIILAACVTQTVTVDSREPVSCIKKSQTVILSTIECTTGGGEVLKN